VVPAESECGDRSRHLRENLLDTSLQIGAVTEEGR
jgi:hypothetical protein